MALLAARELSFSFGGPPLVEGASFALEEGDRLALVGRNGSGKSTLLHLLAGELSPESGEVVRMPGVRVAELGQLVPVHMRGTVFDGIASGLGALGESIATYQRLSTRATRSSEEEARLEAAQVAIQADDAWGLFQKIETIGARLGFEAEAPVGSLSAGARRRVLLGRALVGEPDVLLLDEPTNHLDIHTITWLEGLFSAFRGSMLLVTHDRTFLEAVATGILELDRGRLRSYPGDWKTFVERRAAEVEIEATERAQFDKKLAEEEVWIRRGVKERRKRNMGRVRELLRMREERRVRRERAGSVRMVAQEASRTGRLVIEVDGLSFGFDKKSIVRDFSTTIQRGDRVGIIGPNGAGKTTLLRLLLGELAPLAGSVRQGTNLEIAYFDQLHGALDETKSVRHNITDGSETVTINGNPKHVVGYLQDFLFTPFEARKLVKDLSGGERNRVLLARLFSRPSNVLVLDEPTNDLDMETLELLEDLLLSYQGTMLVVSHDRAFLDSVVTSTIAFDEDGEVREYVGGYSDWVRQRPEAKEPRGAARAAAERGAERSRATTRGADAAVESPAVRRLSYLEKRELEGLPAALDALEQQKAKLLGELARPEIYSGDRSIAERVAAELATTEAKLAETYERWAALEERNG